MADLNEELKDQTLESETEVADEACEACEGAEVEAEAEVLEDNLEEDDKEANEEGKKESKFFKKKKDKKDEQIEELTDKYKRTMAEFDNFRKRTEKEKSAMYEIGARDIVEKILPVVDNFERAFATLNDEEKAAPFADGMDRVYKQMMTALESAGVKPIEAVGKEFDPNLHNAVMHVDDESLGDNIVAEELQKGYTYRDTVVRYSMVKVAN